MKTVLAVLAPFVFGTTLLAASSIHEFTMNSIDGEPSPLSAHKGKVVLVVNVASRCGFTPQYAGLEAIYQKYRDKGFVVLGFPANNFNQEPGTNEEIKQFCTRKYSVTFPMYARISVRGDDQAPLYGFLTGADANAATSGAVRWNFVKFLVDREGKPIARFESDVTPDSPEVIGAIEKALRQH